MASRRRGGALRPRAAALSLLLLLSGGPFAGPGLAEEPPPAIRFVFPWPGSVITEGPVVIGGTFPASAAEAYFLFNGRPLGGVILTGNVFSGVITPPKGYGEVEVRAGEAVARLPFAYGSPVPGQTPYAFHRPIVEGKCSPCHRDVKKSDTLTDAVLCYQCHSATSIMYPFIHGPVATGACLVCHDPHGSSFPGLVRSRPEAMCLTCHDQPSTARHTAGRTRVCTLCHHPHFGTNKRFLREDF